MKRAPLIARPRKSAAESRHARHVRAAGRWQKDRMPRCAPLVDRWLIGGAAMQAEDVGGFFFDWDIQAQRALFVVGAGLGTSLEAALCAAAAQASVRALWKANVSLADLPLAVNAALWQGSAGGQFVSLVCAAADLESGATEIVGAGDVCLLIGGDGSPRIARFPRGPLGMGETLELRRLRVQIAAGQTLGLLASSRLAPAKFEQRSPLLGLLGSLEFDASVAAEEIARHLLRRPNDDCGAGEGAAIVARRTR
jgi:serine phosphatase RsbU (regulator of sigma subunit)